MSIDELVVYRAVCVDKAVQREVVGVFHIGRGCAQTPKGVGDGSRAARTLTQVTPNRVHVF